MMTTPEFRKASSRSRCSRVAKSNSVLVKVPVEGRKVTSVPFLPFASPTTFSGATGIAVAELHVMFLAVAPDAQVEEFATAH